MPVKCSELPGESGLYISETTTVAAALALGGFADSADDGFSSTPAAAAALADGFAYANSLVSGIDGTTSQPSQITDINTMANIIGACLNSDGGSVCTQLMSDTTVQGFRIPSNIWQAVLDMALFPTNNLQNLYGLMTSESFQPVYTSVPATWGISEDYIPVITLVSADLSNVTVTLTGDARGVNPDTLIMVVGGVVTPVDGIGPGYLIMPIPANAAGLAIQAFAPGVASNPIAQPAVQTSIAVSLTPTQSVLGSTFSVIATVSASSGPQPIGSVNCTATGQNPQTVPLIQGQNSSSAALTFSSGSVGELPIACTYPGTAFYESASNNPAVATEQVQVQTVATTTSIVVAPSVTYPGFPSYATVTVAASNPSTIPSEEVSCSVPSVPAPFAGSLSNGIASIPLSGLAVGTYQVTCSYEGVPNQFAASTSSTASASVVPAPSSTWVPASGTMSLARDSATATLLPGGKVLVVGGSTTGQTQGATETSELYDPSSQTFTPSGSMYSKRWLHSATLLGNGLVFVAGGENYYDTEKKETELYYPATGTFSPGPDLPIARASHTATVLQDGRILIAGGVTGAVGQGNYPITELDIYDPGTSGTVSSAGNLQLGRVGHTATLLNNGTVLIAGGRDANNNCISEAEIYNPSTGTATALQMPLARAYHTATPLASGKVLFAGGEDQGGNPLTDLDLFDPVTGTFTHIGNLATGRYGHIAAQLSDGTVVVAGGEVAPAYHNTITASAEIIDLSSNTVAPGPSLNSPRIRATMVSLSDGSAFAIGGSGQDTVLSSAETYLNDSTISGVVNPKYKIVGIGYAPPGSASSVSYQKSFTVGTTTGITKSFSTGEELNVSSMLGSQTDPLKIPGIDFSGSVTATSDTSFVQKGSDNNTVTITNQSQRTFFTNGVADDFHPVNHDYDIIYIWLNPVVRLSYNLNKPGQPGQPAPVSWNGYGYDDLDHSAIDVYGVFVGELNGHFGGLYPGTVTKFQRAWATDEIFEAPGEGPALNAIDIANILKADPFADSSYALTFDGQDQSTSTDGRFTISGGIEQTPQQLPYQQAAPGAPAPKTQYFNSYTDSSTSTHTTDNTNSMALGVKETFGGTLFGVTVSSSLEQKGTWTWEDVRTHSITSTTSTTDSLTIQGPPCSGIPCNPQYSGPPAFNVYQDNRFATFMFYPLYQ